jgi:hypothetical protein
MDRAIELPIIFPFLAKGLVNESEKEATQRSYPMHPRRVMAIFGKLNHLNSFYL